MISLPNPTNKMNIINPMFELLYEKCRQDPDLLATIIDEYLTSLNDTQLNELEDFMVNNFGDE